MSFWIFFLVIIYLCFAKYKLGGIKRSSRLPIIGFFLIILLSAIRFDIGWDYSNYYLSVYPRINKEALLNTEPISKEIIKLSYYLNYPPALFIAFSILTYGLLGYAISKYSKNIYISILVYLVIFYLQTLSVIRQGLAISLIIYAIPLLMKKKYIQYAIVTIISYFIHESSIVALVFIPLYMVINRKTYFLVIALALLSFLSLRMIVERIAPGYVTYILNSDEYKGGSVILYYYCAIIGALCYYSYKVNNSKLLKLSCISIIGVLFPFFLGGHIGGRIALYFYAPLIYALPILYEYRINKSLKKLSILSFYLVFIMTIFVDQRNPIKSGLTPYKTILTENIYSPKFK